MTRSELIEKIAAKNPHLMLKDVENIVAVTDGNDDGSAYKTILLNYNNYTVRVSYEHDGVSYDYNIPAYSYVIIKH